MAIVKNITDILERTPGYIVGPVIDPDVMNAIYAFQIYPPGGGAFIVFRC